MKITELRVEDYLEWLKNQEAFVLFSLDYCEPPAERVELGEELQLIREIKHIVSKHGGEDEE